MKLYIRQFQSKLARPVFQRRRDRTVDMTPEIVGPTDFLGSTDRLNDGRHLKQSASHYADSGMPRAPRDTNHFSSHRHRLLLNLKCAGTKEKFDDIAFV